MNFESSMDFEVIQWILENVMTDLNSEVLDKQMMN